MKIVGLTGGIASGKSAVARMFAARGAATLSADDDARAVLALDSPTLAEVFAAFPAVRRPDGTLDRSGLAAAIFADPAARARLEAIMHPAIFARMSAAINYYREEARSASSRFLLLLYEVPLLYEKNREALFDAVIATYAPPEVQADRLQKRERAAGRPPLTETQIAERFAAQFSGEEKMRRADFVIRTDTPLGDTGAAVERIYRQLTQESTPPEATE